MNVQYYHNRKYYQSDLLAVGGSTIAMEEIQAWLTRTLVVGDTIEKSVGSARCSDKENYNKKVGRELAKSRMKKVKLTVVNIVENEKELLLVLTDKENKVYTFRHVNGKERAHFLGVE